MASKNDIDLAKISLENYFNLVNAEKIDSIPYLFDSHFFSKTDTAQLIYTINALRAKFGKVLTHDLIRTESTISTENGINEKRLVLSYKVTYATGYVAKEYFRYFIGTHYVGKISGFRSEDWHED